MTNETVANIAVTVTAAMLATAAVAFTMSGNAPADPAAGDLPVISVQNAMPHASNSSTSSTVPQPLQSEPPVSVAEAPSSGGTQAPRSSASGPTKSKAGTTSTAKSGTTAAVVGAAAAIVPDGGATSNDATPDHQSNEHEVVHPRVHETDEHGHHSQDPQIEED
jgi:hypothetical protein